MPSYAIIGLAAAVFVVFLVGNAREAAEDLRAEDAAVARMEGILAEAAPPEPPPRGGPYRFAWETGGDLPPLLLALPEGQGVAMFAGARGKGIFAYELFGESPPDVTRLRVHVAREGGAPLPPGWRKVR